ncbi:1-phosphatidylinositol 4,5-bisphosphate phosphodiesterase beta-4-like isoform X2 [Paramacrobiotus metropolitanus]|uniref:1-phosphatidylinositol 4,5-bisphosphate phosphodiesterase beta-4-like isoform X2 n=1 Tax=Paramacrobiotus metropolitanus TaxID=2943436 RepID=UPI0024463CAD|nr:1-phosphatidylinositol 4,5-bisphosphate phosphodiesterase beta-4-like isoform X2 [Paramacrobiotus metropolitanus]
MSFVAPDPGTCKLWTETLRKLAHNIKANHLCPMTMLHKHWKRLALTTNERGKISVRRITRTFALERTEETVLQCLHHLIRSRSQNDEADPKDFTFEKFHLLYHTICSRHDIRDLFKQMSKGHDYLEVGTLVKFFNEEQRDSRLHGTLHPLHTKERVIALIGQYETDPKFRRHNRMSLAGFCNYLMSDENAPVSLDRLDVHQDMDQPLSHYFINSSHNTYLTGRQFGGKSSVDMYRQVLLAGCRCIELDCWDGKGADQEPIITHGKAVCTDILFKDAIIAIRDTAFVVSDFPVILSFENHCSKPQQDKMAKYCEEILGDLLLKAPLDGYRIRDGAPLPSPCALKRKILIKNKRLKQSIERQELELLRQGHVDAVLSDDPSHDPATKVDGEERAPTSTDDRPLAAMLSASSIHSRPTILAVPDELPPPDEYNPPPGPQGEDPHPERPLDSRPIATAINGPSYVKAKWAAWLRAALRRGKMARSSRTPVDCADAPARARSGSMLRLHELLKSNTLQRIKTIRRIQNPVNQDDETSLQAYYEYTGATTDIHPRLSSLVNYIQAVKFQGFEVAAKRNLSHCVSSFSDAAGSHLLQTSALQFVSYNIRQLSRIYPRGPAVESSNFPPYTFWSAGCQMVALNFQTPDVAMQLNSAKFEYNANTGYLLKPDRLRRSDRPFHPGGQAMLDGVVPAYCSVRVISGQFLSDYNVGTYVEVDMYGLPADTCVGKHRTRTIPNNGLNPVYKEEKFEFRKVILPELAMLRFGAYDEDGKVLGQRVLPLDGLQAGYRHITLRSEANFPLPLSTLFCHIVLKTYIPDGLGPLADALCAPQGANGRRLSQSALVNSDRHLVRCPASPSTHRPTSESADSGEAAGSVYDAHLIPVITITTDGSPLAVVTDELKQNKLFVILLAKQAAETKTLLKKHAKNARKGRKVKFHGDNLRGVDGAPSPRSITGSCSRRSANCSQLISQHLHEEQELMRKHCLERCELLKRLLDEHHNQQCAKYAAKHKRENQELESQQARQSMEQRKALEKDKSIKKEAERNCRINELCVNNAKRFSVERKQAQRKQQQEVMELVKLQSEEREALAIGNETALQESFSEEGRSATEMVTLV